MVLQTKFVFGICMLLLFNACSAEPQTLKQLWRDSRAEAYAAPSHAELARAEALFMRHFRGEWDEALADGWRRLGFEAIIFDGDYIVIREDPDRSEGRGFYVFRCNPVSRLVLQLPHSYKDSYTGSLGFKLFQEADYRAAAWNNVIRDEADVAHLAYSYFNAFTAAFSQSISSGRIVQLHGFARDKRKSRAGRSAQLILSAAHKTTTPGLNTVATCLRSVIAEGLRIYPLHVSELGGTTNTNAHMMRAHGERDFVHVEMSKELRKSLRGDAGLRDRFNHCLFEGAR